MANLLWFNSNIRCIEIINRINNSLKEYGFNSNIRCIEMQNKTSSSNAYLKFNSNIRCIEIYAVNIT